MFGPIGLVVGSRANSKEKRTVTPYLILNYVRSNGEMAALMFEDDPNSYGAAKFVDKIRPQIPKIQVESYKL
ncbi:hypothetical protein D3C81_1762020 [compost metagenome]